nr:MAG TPA_asm: hypothetical protein [Caudoviricetes sp.]
MSRNILPKKVKKVLTNSLGWYKIASKVTFLGKK